MGMLSQSEVTELLSLHFDFSYLYLMFCVETHWQQIINNWNNRTKLWAEELKPIDYTLTEQNNWLGVMFGKWVHSLS